LLGDPGSKYLCGKLGKTGRKKKSIQERREMDPTAELNRRDQVTATMPGPVSFERGEQRSIIR
jgi:hypothetical protein